MRQLLPIFVTVLTILPQFAIAGKPRVDRDEAIAYLREQNGFAANLTSAQCEKLFPIGRWIERPISSFHPESTSKTFKIYSFMARPFDPNKPSVLVIDGGPGDARGTENLNSDSNLFPSANVIFFHLRSSGCSAFPSETPDEFISEPEAAADVDAIRQAYGIQSWQAILGLSHGTNVARQYAHYFPMHVNQLVLASLYPVPVRNSVANKMAPASAEPSAAEQADTQRLMKILTKRRNGGHSAITQLNEAQFASFATQLQQYFETFSLYDNFLLVGAWNHFRPQFAEFYSSQHLSLPDYLNSNTFRATVHLAYSGDDESSDVALALLAHEFGFLQLDENQLQGIRKVTDGFALQLFPFLSKNYVDDFMKSSVMSWRTYLAMQKNDRNEPGVNYCTPVDLLVLHGTLDSATSLSLAEEYLGDKTCASGNNLALIEKDGGHLGFFSERCLTDFVDKWIFSKNPPPPTRCQHEVSSVR
jgi:pimeloyl-ACP methyl ester carboxylesterase